MIGKVRGTRRAMQWLVTTQASRCRELWLIAGYDNGNNEFCEMSMKSQQLTGRGHGGKVISV